MPASIERVTVEHYTSSTKNPAQAAAHTVLGISHATPRLSWRFDSGASRSCKNWKQTSYTVVVKGAQRDERSVTVESAESVLVPWPFEDEPLKPRERVTLSVSVVGTCDCDSGEQTVDAPALIVERALEQRNDAWEAKIVSSSDTSRKEDEPHRPYKLRRKFSVDPSVSSESLGSARLYVTALGGYELCINGKRVGDHILAPGWQSYKHRHHYQTYDVSELVRPGDNEIQAWLAEGWYGGALGWMRKRIYGDRLGLFGQLELGAQVVVKTDETWDWTFGEIVDAQLYDGEAWDMSKAGRDDWKPVEVLPGGFKGTLIAPEAPPVRQTGQVHPVEIITTPSGKTVVDFGQNLVGWVRLNKLPTSTATVVLRHAEVMEKEELGVRPLRTAKCTDTLILDDKSKLSTWEPKFTSHGFRYVQVEGMVVDKSSLTAIVYHSDMEPTGQFECSHKMITQLHKNVIWGMRGNFVSVPTDCPQRDERLGWTGDIQVFGPTAAFLYDCRGMLGDWLSDVAEEQLKDLGGSPSVVVPDVLSAAGWPNMPQSIWDDVTILLPWELYQATGDTGLLEKQYESMTTWLDKGVERDPTTRMWSEKTLQLADWLDPAAPPDDPGDSRTDMHLVANAYLVYGTRTVAKIAKILDKSADAERYQKDYELLLKGFRHNYITPYGRLSSDSQTAYALAIKFGLLDGQSQIDGAATRLRTIVAKNVFKVGTGFAGTPVILHALAEAGELGYAYRMMQEKQCPSWLYPVSMGATTVWERWNSMLPDGTINPGEMTSFNHYALGAAVSFLHKYVGGISILEPGWRRVLVAPRPGGTITHATVSHVSPYGKTECSWKIAGEGDEQTLEVHVVIPPNTTAVVSLPSGGVQEQEVGSGSHVFRERWVKDESWPPRAPHVPFTPPPLDEPAL